MKNNPFAMEINKKWTQTSMEVHHPVHTASLDLPTNIYWKTNVYKLFAILLKGSRLLPHEVDYEK